MFENYIFFKNSTGGIYGVSPRVIEAGFNPDDNHVEATQEEKESFIQRAVEQSSLPQPKTLEELQVVALTLQDKGVPPEDIKTLVGVNLKKLDKKTIKHLKSLRSKQETNSVKRSQTRADPIQEKLKRAQKETAQREETLRLEAEALQLELESAEKAAVRKARREEALKDQEHAAEIIFQQNLEDKISAHLEIANQESMGIYEKDIVIQRESEAAEKAKLRKTRREAALEVKRLTIENASQKLLEEKKMAHKKVVEEKAAKRQQGTV